MIIFSKSKKTIGGSEPKFFKTNEEKQEVIDLYNDGWVITELAEKYNVSVGPIKRIIAEMSDKVLPKNERANNRYKMHRRQNQVLTKDNQLIDKGKIFALYHANWSIYEIAKEMDVSEEDIIQVLDSEVK